MQWHFFFFLKHKFITKSTKTSTAIQISFTNLLKVHTCETLLIKGTDRETFVAKVSATKNIHELLSVSTNASWIRCLHAICNTKVGWDANKDQQDKREASTFRKTSNKTKGCNVYASCPWYWLFVSAEGMQRVRNTII